MRDFCSCWFRYLFFKAATHILFFVFIVTSVFFAIEIATHFQYLQNISLSPLQLFYYYLGTIAERSAFLISLGTLFAILKMLYTLNIHHEITALSVSGLAFSRILRPILIATLLASSLIFGIKQWIRPHLVSLKSLKVKKQKNLTPMMGYQLKSYALPAGGTLIYLDHNHSPLLEDVFWLQADGTLLHANRLDSASLPMRAFEVTHLSTEPTAKILKEEESELWEGLHIPVQTRQKQPSVISPLTAIQILMESRMQLHEISISKVASYLIFDLTHMLIPFWLLGFATPYFAIDRRQHYLVAHLSSIIVGFVACWMLLTALQVAAESGLMTPFTLFLFAPIGISLLSLLYFLQKMEIICLPLKKPFRSYIALMPFKKLRAS